MGEGSVLELINQDMGESISQSLKHLGFSFEQIERFHDQVVEVDCIIRFQMLFIFTVEIANLVRSIRTENLALCLDIAEEGGELIEVEGLNHVVEILDYFLDQGHAVVGIVNGEVVLESEMLDVLLQHTHAERVEGGGRQFFQRKVCERLYTVPHLGCRLVGECQGEN